MIEIVATSNSGLRTLVMEGNLFTNFLLLIFILDYPSHFFFNFLFSYN